MPGPGGGSRGGGFGGGSFGGGGGHGGGFGGGRPGGFGGHHHHHHHHGPIFYGGFGPRRYYHGGGGCLGGLASIILVPIILIAFFSIFLFASLSSAIVGIASGGVVRYDEEQMQDYANAQYIAEFGESSAYEDNLLVVFLTNEEHNDYYAIAWVGDNVNYSIRKDIGDRFIAVVNNDPNINYYKYSLGGILAGATDSLKSIIENKNLTSSFVTEQDHSKMTQPHVVNLSDVSINETSVNDALERFTESTGIPAVIVVDTAENVFGKTMPVGDLMISLVAVVIIAVAVFYIVKGVKESRSHKRGEG